jgi:hypothetical protein
VRAEVFVWDLGLLLLRMSIASNPVAGSYCTGLERLQNVSALKAKFMFYFQVFYI